MYPYKGVRLKSGFRRIQSSIHLSLLLFSGSLVLGAEILELRPKEPCLGQSLTKSYSGLTVDVRSAATKLFEIAGSIYKYEICEPFKPGEEYKLRFDIPGQAPHAVPCDSSDQISCLFKSVNRPDSELRAFLVGEVTAELLHEGKSIRQFSILPRDQILNFLQESIVLTDFQGFVRLKRFPSGCPTQVTPEWLGQEAVSIEALEVGTDRSPSCNYSSRPGSESLGLDKAADNDSHSEKHHQDLRIRVVELRSMRLNKSFKVRQSDVR